MCGHVQVWEDTSLKKTSLLLTTGLWHEAPRHLFASSQIQISDPPWPTHPFSADHRPVNTSTWISSPLPTRSMGSDNLLLVFWFKDNPQKIQVLSDRYSIIPKEDVQVPAKTDDPTEYLGKCLENAMPVKAKYLEDGFYPAQILAMSGKPFENFLPSHMCESHVLSKTPNFWDTTCIKQFNNILSLCLNILEIHNSPCIVWQLDVSCRNQ